MTKETSRIRTRLYTELLEDALEMKGWTKVELVKQINSIYPEFEVTEGQVYEFFLRPRNAGAYFAKAVEWTLGVNLPPQCYYNASKRAQ